MTTSLRKLGYRLAHATATIGLLASSCQPSSSECTRTLECPAGEVCVSSGGLFVGGGRCVPRNLLRDAGDVADPEDGDAADIVPSDADTSDTPATDGCTGEACSGTCNYRGETRGVCRNQTETDEGDCTEPSDYLPATDDESPRCDGRDNDCDGEVDEGCSCEPGEQRGCYTGPGGTAGTGICERGTQSCNDSVFSTCEGETTPSNETCDDGDDNDCDGAVNEGCSCTYDPSDSNDSDDDESNAAGVCTDQTRNSQGRCAEPDDFESPEISCGDGFDNDCDGSIDCDDSNCRGETCSGAGTVCRARGDCEESDCSDGADNDGDGRVDCLDPGCQSTSDCEHRIFVTADAFQPGKSPPTGCSNLSEARTLCNDAASTAGLAGNWRPLLSNSNVNASRILAISGPVHNLNGDMVAASRSDFWNGKSNFDHAIAYTADRKRKKFRVWTGTQPSGKAASSHCDNWTLRVGLGRTGISTATGDSAIDDANSPCSDSYHLYCID